MVFVKLMGGLGNQMFQYACAKRIAVANETELFLDTSILDRSDKSKSSTIREFELGIFDLEELKAPFEVVKKFYKKDLVHRLIKKYSAIKVIKEKGDLFEPHVLGISGSVYLIGFWQSEKYFNDISDTIKRDFTFPSSPENDYVVTLQKKIGLHENSVSVHIRRGDYIKNKKGLPTKFENLTIDYYQKGMDLIKSKFDDVHFFLFSDDPHYVFENFNNLDDITIVQHDEFAPNYVDMKLMSSCNHNIIANSSYSWWGAWLNNNSEKLVIGPKLWFKNYSSIELDRMPASWKLL